MTLRFLCRHCYLHRYIYFLNTILFLDSLSKWLLKLNLKELIKNERTRNSLRCTCVFYLLRSEPEELHLLLFARRHHSRTVGWLAYRRYAFCPTIKENLILSDKKSSKIANYNGQIIKFIQQLKSVIILKRYIC